jgi:hypothetical protein
LSYGQVVEAWSRWRGRADTDRRWMFWALVSVILHVPFTPLVGLLGLVGWALSDANDIPEGPPITAIPIDILEDEPPAPAPEVPAAPVEPVAPPAPAATPDPPKPRAPDAPKATPSAAPSAAPRASAAPSASVAPRPSASVAAPGAPSPIGDPVAMSGGARRVVDPNANVRLIVDTAKLRGHPLGRRIGSMLARIHQWRDFMGPTGLDPVRDIDRILVVGPQLRRSGDVVAVIQHNIGRERMRAAIDALVKRDTANGAWIESSVPVARANADRAERYFVLPSERIVAVTPKSALASAEQLGKANLKALPDTEIVRVHIATPHRAFIGIPIQIPTTIAWARARVSPLEGGGARVDIEAEDASPDTARDSARHLERAIDGIARPDLGMVGALLGVKLKSFIEKVSFHSDEKTILGEIVLTADQIETLFGFAEMQLVPPDSGSSGSKAPRPPGTTAPRATPTTAPAGP